MRRVALLFVALFTAPLAAAIAQRHTAAPPSQRAAAAPAVPHDSVRGAIRSIDVHSRTVEVTAGVGYALRVVALRIPASVSITNRDSAQPNVIALGQLKLGDVVRAQFGGTAAPFVVYTIERLGRMTTGVDSTP
ncbi:MAG: hypothetical protein DMD54_02015 [Gemmatimonadetes bacterium]|nr:MAG: hypothetical protein DMD54_02015 [Gemmatimonadota bacterium]